MLQDAVLIGAKRICGEVNGPLCDLRRCVMMCFSSLFSAFACALVVSLCGWGEVHIVSCGKVA